jgi:hypothetical protein
MSEKSKNRRNEAKAEEGQKFLADAKAHLVFTNTGHFRDAIWRKPDGSFWREQYAIDDDFIRYTLEPISWRRIEEIVSKFAPGELERATPPREMSYDEL